VCAVNEHQRPVKYAKSKCFKNTHTVIEYPFPPCLIASSYV